jgi:hypothetical protein
LSLSTLGDIPMILQKHVLLLSSAARALSPSIGGTEG